jgi:hypothetical protein
MTRQRFQTRLVTCVLGTRDRCSLIDNPKAIGSNDQNDGEEDVEEDNTRGEEEVEEE